MSEAEASPVDEIRVDSSNLYREEIFTDLKVATIRRLSPVEPNGSDDTSRPVIYVGQTTLLSQAGPVRSSARSKPRPWRRPWTPSRRPSTRPSNG